VNTTWGKKRKKRTKKGLDTKRGTGVSYWGVSLVLAEEQVRLRYFAAQNVLAKA